MKFCFTLLALVTALTSFSSNSETTQTIRGFVYDKTTNAPIPGVKVLIVGSNPKQGAITDAIGAFEITGVSVGRHDISFSYIGYSTFIQKEVRFDGGEETTLEVFLVENTKELGEVIVTSDERKVRNEAALVSARSLAVDELSRVPVALDDPARVARRFPGVSPSPYITTNEIAIRGNAARGVLWRLDGIDIYNPNHFGQVGGSGGSLTLFSQRLLSGTDFYSGAFPADYGNALGGVFDVRFRNGNTHKRQHSFQLNLLGVDFATEGPLSKSGRASYIANYRLSATTLVEQFLSLGFLPIYQDLSFKFHFKTKKGATFNVFGIGGTSSTSQSPVLDTAAWSDLNSSATNYGYYSRAITGTVGASYVKPINERTYMKATLVGTGIQSTLDGWYLQKDLITADTAFFRLERDARVSVQTYINHKFSNRHTHRSGIIVHGMGTNVQAINKDPDFIGDVDYPLTDTTVFSHGQTAMVQAYSRSQFYLTENWQLNAGVHAIYLAYTGEVSVEPRAGARYQINDKNSISLGYGLHSQMDPLFTFTAQTRDTITGATLYQNRDLGLNKAHHATLAYYSQWSDKWRFGAEVYYQYLFNMTVGVDLPISRIGGYNRSFESTDLNNGGTGQNYGLELALERSFKEGLYVITNVSLFNSTYTANDNVERPSQYNAQIIFNGIIGKEWRVAKKSDKPKFLSVNLSGTFSGPQYFTALDLEESVEAGFFVANFENPNTEKQDALLLIDASIAYRSNKDKFNSELTLQISNLFNRRPVAGVIFDREREEQSFVYGSGIIPILGWRVSF